MKKPVYIYAKNKESDLFLKGFFKREGSFSVSFFNSEKKLLQKLTQKNPSVLIIGNPDDLKEITLKKTGCPVIAMIAGDVTTGIHSIMKHDIESYLISPFHNEDFEHKLNLALNKKGLFENMYKEKQDLEAIIEIIHLVSSTLDPKEVLYFVVKKISEIIDVTRCSIISIPIEEKDHAYVISTFEDSKISHIKLDLKKYPEIRKALTTKSTVVIKDALNDPLLKEVRSIITPLRIRSIVVIPIIFRNEVIGTLFLRTSSAGYTFTDREIGLCNAVAYASSNALYNSFLYSKLESEKSKLEKLAITDYLTGIFNIRYFYHRLEEEFSRAQRYKIPLSCIMFDIDHFKKINDTYGHRTGDMVLREFAQWVKNYGRKSDVFARYGGEEFIMLLPQTSMDGAVAEAERLQKVIKTHKFKALKNKRGVTVSIGIATSPNKKIKTQDDIITFADNALFKAKKSGRDQIRAWE